jgi:hypothetical protein
MVTRTPGTSCVKLSLSATTVGQCRRRRQAEAAAEAAVETGQTLEVAFEGDVADATSAGAPTACRLAQQFRQPHRKCALVWVTRDSLARCCAPHLGEVMSPQPSMMMPMWIEFIAPRKQGATVVSASRERIASNPCRRFRRGGWLPIRSLTSGERVFALTGIS